MLSASVSTTPAGSTAQQSCKRSATFRRAWAENKHDDPGPENTRRFLHITTTEAATSLPPPKVVVAVAAQHFRRGTLDPTRRGSASRSSLRGAKAPPTHTLCIRSPSPPTFSHAPRAHCEQTHRQTHLYPWTAPYTRCRPQRPGEPACAPAARPTPSTRMQTRQTPSPRPPASAGRWAAPMHPPPS